MKLADILKEFNILNETFVYKVENPKLPQGTYYYASNEPVGRAKPQLFQGTSAIGAALRALNPEDIKSTKATTTLTKVDQTFNSPAEAKDWIRQQGGSVGRRSFYSKLISMMKLLKKYYGLQSAIITKKDALIREDYNPQIYIKSTEISNIVKKLKDLSQDIRDAKYKQREGQTLNQREVDLVKLSQSDVDKFTNSFNDYVDREKRFTKPGQEKGREVLYFAIRPKKILQPSMGGEKAPSRDSESATLPVRKDFKPKDTDIDPSEETKQLQAQIKDIKDQLVKAIQNGEADVEKELKQQLKKLEQDLAKSKVKEKPATFINPAAIPSSTTSSTFKNPKQNTRNRNLTGAQDPYKHDWLSLKESIVRFFSR